MYYKDFPLEKAFIFNYVFTTAELFWSTMALALVLLSVVQIIIPKEPRPFIHWFFFAFAGLGSLCFVVQSCTVLAMFEPDPYENETMINSRQLLVAIGTSLVDIAFTSLVLMLRQVHRMLRLKRKQNEIIFLVANIAQLFICLANEEVSIEMTLNSATLCRNFGLFAVVYNVYVFYYFFLAFGVLADVAAFFNKILLFLTCIGAVSYPATRYYALGLAVYLLHPPWALYLDSVYNSQLFVKKLPSQIQLEEIFSGLGTSSLLRLANTGLPVHLSGENRNLAKVEENEDESGSTRISHESKPYFHNFDICPASSSIV